METSSDLGAFPKNDSVAKGSNKGTYKKSMHHRRGATHDRGISLRDEHTSWVVS